MQIKSINGYHIDYEESIPEDSKTIMIAMHGFCGDKTSSCISKLQESAWKEKIGLVKFDWPAHGESDAPDECLKIDNCLDDLDIIVNLERQKYPNAEFVAFATSFGGYITMIYHSKHPDVFSKVILRSPALKFYNVLKNNIMTEEQYEKMMEQGYFTYGFERKINISREFVEQVKKYKVENLFKNKELKNVSIIHGNLDDIVPYSDSKEFVEEHHTEMYMIEGADHRYKGPRQIEQVVRIVMNVMNRDK